MDFEQNNEYPEFDGSLESMQEYLVARLKEMKLRISRAEIMLETIIRDGWVDILVDEKGLFTYRFTAEGSKLFAEKTGVLPPSNDISFHEMY